MLQFEEDPFLKDHCEVVEFDFCSLFLRVQHSLIHHRTLEKEPVFMKKLHNSWHTHIYDQTFRLTTIANVTS